MKKKILLFLFSSFTCLLLFTSCSGFDLKNPVTSSDDSELRCEKLHDYSNANSFWKFTYENIPTVTYDEAISGAYDSSYVCLDGIFLSSYVEFLVVFPSNNDSYFEKSFLPDDTIGSDLIDGMKDGDSIKLCVFVQNGNFSYHPVAIRKINKEFDFNVTEYRKTKQEQQKTQITKISITPTPIQNASESIGSRNTELNGRGHSDRGREKPMYADVIGYAVVSSYDYDLQSSDTSLNAQWTVPKYVKDRENYIESGTISHKTEVLVKSQDLKHEGYSAYSGYLLVEQVDTHEQYYIDVQNFITKPYWTYEDLEDAASIGYYLATYSQNSDYYPVSKDNETIALDDKTTVLVSKRTGTYGKGGPDNKTHPIEAIVFKEWKYGYGGVSVFFNPEDLTILY